MSNIKKNCRFLDILKRIDVKIKPYKITKDTYYSVWDKQSKKLINKTFEDCFLLDTNRYLVRKIISVDLEGNFIYEGDYIWYLDINIGESLAIIREGTAVNQDHMFGYEDKYLWNKCIVVGNKYEGLIINDYIVQKYCIDLDMLKRFDYLIL